MAALHHDALAWIGKTQHMPLQLRSMTGASNIAAR
jgi:hypothetical protein